MDCQSSIGSWAANQVLVHGLPIKSWFMDCQSSLGSWTANQVLVHGLPIKSWVLSCLVSYTICTSYVHFCFKSFLFKSNCFDHFLIDCPCKCCHQGSS